MNFRNSRLLPSFALVATAVVVLLVYACKRETLEPTIPSSQISSVSTTTKSMSLRQQLMSMNISEQKDKFRSLSPEEMHSVWADKFAILLNSPKFSKKEKNFIQEVSDFISPEVYKADYELDKLIAKGEVWKNYAINSLGWTEQDVLILLETLFTPDEFEAALATAQAKTGGGGGPSVQPNCNCSYSFLGCYVGTFGEYNSCSRNFPCNPVYGCGIGWRDNCRGYCVWEG